MLKLPSYYSSSAAYRCRIALALKVHGPWQIERVPRLFNLRSPRRLRKEKRRDG